MLVLGIESSCDETAAAVVREDGTVLSDVIQSQVALHTAYGGVVPELASRDHLRNGREVIKTALKLANTELASIDAIAVTNRPGLVGALLVGVQLAKGMAWGADKPLIGVDHLMGHLLAIFLDRDPGSRPPLAGAPRAPAFPYVCLLVSGGHTAIYRVDAPHVGAVKELGATRDDAAGEAFDKVAKLLGLGYPGGPVIDKLAPRGDATRVKLSPPMAQKGNPDFSFSGTKTQVAQLIEKHQGLPPGVSVEDICASFQATVTTVLAKKLIDAALSEGVGDIAIGGGVAANRELGVRVQKEAARHGLRAWLPPLASCTDNAAMIAYAGAQRVLRGESDDFGLVTKSDTALPRVTRKGRGRRGDLPE